MAEATGPKVAVVETTGSATTEEPRHVERPQPRETTTAARPRGSVAGAVLASKVRKTLTLDPDIVETFGRDSAALSATVNAILREEKDRRARRDALAAYVADLDEQFGAPDPAQVQRFRDLLG